MADNPARPHETEERRRQRLAREAAAQRGPVPPEVGETVDDTLNEHPPHEQVSRLGTTAEEAERELRRRQQTDFEGQVIPHQKRRPAMLWTIIVLAVLLIAGGLWSLFD